MHRMVLIGGSSHPPFVERLAAQLNVPLGAVSCDRFNNGEVCFNLKEHVCAADVYVVQSHCEPVNDMLMELLMMIHACRLAAAGSITAILPLMPYSRQDRITTNTKTISSSLVAHLLVAAGCKYVITCDLHSPQQVGFFSIPCINISIHLMIVLWLKDNFPNYKNLVIVSPDHGGVDNATTVSHGLDVPLVILHKERIEPGKVHNMTLMGDVNNKACLLIDDIVDTGSTLCYAASCLIKAGASKVFAFVTHIVLTSGSVERITASDLEYVICTNTMPLSKEAAESGKFCVIDSTPLFVKAIWDKRAGLTP